MNSPGDHDDQWKKDLEDPNVPISSYFRPESDSAFMKSFYRQFQYQRQYPKWIPSGVVWFDRLRIAISAVAIIALFLGVGYIILQDTTQKAAVEHAKHL